MVKVDSKPLPIDLIRKALQQPTQKVWEPVIGEIVSLFLPVKPFRDFGKEMDVCDDNGNCLRVSKKSLTKTYIDQNTDFIMKAMKDAVLTVAKQLAKANNTVTTLEIKTELRRDYPYYYWTQDVVSNYMSQLAGDGVFTYTDNGTYRTYRLASSVSAPSVVKSFGSIHSGTPATAVANKSVGILSGKVSSKIATPPVKRKRGRPAKSTTHISIANVLVKSVDPNFEEVTITRRTGPTTYTLLDIKGQKKSPLSYIKRSMDNVTSIKVNGVTYLVK